MCINHERNETKKAFGGARAPAVIYVSFMCTFGLRGNPRAYIADERLSGEQHQLLCAVLSRCLRSGGIGPCPALCRSPVVFDWTFESIEPRVRRPIARVGRDLGLRYPSMMLDRGREWTCLLLSSLHRSLVSY